MARTKSKRARAKKTKEAEVKKARVIKTVYICEECGREYDNLPFPASCKCGNYCEDFFRPKDMHDYEDDRAGRPLLGVRYDPEVLVERRERLARKKEEKSGEKAQETVNVVQEITKDEATPVILEQAQQGE